MSTKEAAEQEYARLRMAGATISDDAHDDSKPASSSSKPSAPEKKETQSLDDTISAAAAEDHKQQGNALYKAADYTAAIQQYTQAANSAHATDDNRAVYLANRAAAHLKLQHFSDVVSDTTEALRLRAGYAKALARRREAREKLADWRGALNDAKELNASAGDIQRLEMLASQKEQKDREEAMESLKGLGNSILSNFGMSLDDFSMEKDPQTGSYSVKMGH